MLPEIHEIRLDNGFRAILVERRGLPLVASVTCYSVGSRDERTGETGVSHFLEHMMFKGTGRYAKGEIDALTAKLGGSNNAFTDHDWTAYYFNLASDRWETALEVEADRMVNCLLDPAEFEAEKSVVLEELAMGEDDPWTGLWHATEALAFDVHPYRHPVIGYRQDLERLNVEGMRDYYRRHYGPNRACLVAIGDLDTKKTTKRIQQLFGSLQPAPERAPVLDEPETGAERRGIVRAPGSLTRIGFAAHTCRIGERDDFALDLLSHVLAGGRTSRLHRRLVIDEELATLVSTHNETRLDPGLFWIAVELRPGADAERVEAIVREELAKLCADGVTADELKRARVQVRAAFLFEDETCLDAAQRIGRFAMLARGGYRVLGDALATFDSLDRRELREVAIRIFAPERWTVTWSVPRDTEVQRPRARRRTARKRTKTAAAKRKTEAAVKTVPARKKPTPSKAKAKKKRRIVKRRTPETPPRTEGPKKGDAAS